MLAHCFVSYMYLYLHGKKILLKLIMMENYIQEDIQGGKLSQLQVI